MPKDTPLKSAYELAMERLRDQDREAGVETRKPLTAKQKSRIAELRRAAKAKLAEIEILRDDRRGVETDPEKSAEIEENYRRDRDRIERVLETDVEAIRSGKNPTR